MELQKLMLSDVNAKEGTCYVRRGKGGRPRMVVFGPAAADALRRYLRAAKSLRARYWAEGDSPVFLSRYSIALGYGGLGFMLKARGDAAGIPDMHAHLLRHAWRHYAQEAGLNDSEICTLAGWTSTRQLARYGRQWAVQRATTAARANPVGRVLRRHQA